MFCVVALKKGRPTPVRNIAFRRYDIWKIRSCFDDTCPGGAKRLRLSTIEGHAGYRTDCWKGALGWLAQITLVYMNRRCLGTQAGKDVFIRVREIRPTGNIRSKSSIRKGPDFG